MMAKKVKQGRVEFTAIDRAYVAEIEGLYRAACVRMLNEPDDVVFEWLKQRMIIAADMRGAAEKIVEDDI